MGKYSEQQKVYYQNNKEKWKLYAKRRKESGSKALSDKKYRENNKEKSKERKRNWRHINLKKLKHIGKFNGIT